MNNMLGKSTPTGPGGKNCVCCKAAPGKARKKERRAARDKEKRMWKSDINSFLAV